jgi:SAM-dependent methyltransferase
MCPVCRQSTVNINNSNLSSCGKGHEFRVVDRIVDLMPSTADRNLLNEEEHWDKVAAKGGRTGVNYNPNPYMENKAVENVRNIIERIITKEWPNYSNKVIYLGEIGCGSGSVVKFLHRMRFEKVYYFGADISLKQLQSAAKRKILPNKWEGQFIRASANIPLFTSNSLDIVFSVAALHHLKLDPVIEWVAKSLKSNGLFIVYEPSDKNPVAKIGRKLISPDFFTEDERPISPNQVKQIASYCGLRLVYENGFDFLTIPLAYLIEILKMPTPVAFCAYYVSRLVDYFIRSPSLNYYFLQIYKKL